MDEHAYEKLLDFGNMYEAYRRAARNKHYKAEVVEFELDLAHNLWELINQLEQRTYRIGGYHKFRIHDPKEREIQALSFRDRVVQHCLCDNILAPWFAPRLIYDNAACQQGKGTHFALDRLSGFLREHHRQHGTEGYILKYDVRSYFASIDHETLKCMIADMPDLDVIFLLVHIIDSYAAGADPATGARRGLPMGNQTSQWFALRYLDPMDRLIKERMRVRHYVRYMDDGVLVHPSKEYLCEVLAGMREEAALLKLDFNQKTQIFPVSQGVDFLGFHFYLTHTGKVVRRLRTSNKRRWKRRLKKFEEEYRAGEVSAEEVNRSLQSYRAHLAHGHTYKLQQQALSNFVLTRATTGEERRGAGDGRRGAGFG